MIKCGTVRTVFYVSLNLVQERSAVPEPIPRIGKITMSPERRITLGDLSEAPELRLVGEVACGEWASLVQQVRDGNTYHPSLRKNQVKN